jgi:hypothetical protein
MRPKVDLSFVLDTLEIPTRASIINRSHLEYPVIIGRRNLGKFLIDTNK